MAFAETVARLSMRRMLCCGCGGGSFARKNLGAIARQFAPPHRQKGQECQKGIFSTEVSFDFMRS